VPYQNIKHFDDLRHAHRDKELQKYAKKKKKVRGSAQHMEVLPAADGRGVVGAVHSGACVVHIRGERRTCRPLPGVSVGDEVELSGDRVVAIAPRRTMLSRRDPGNRQNEQVLAANVDIVIIVSSVGTPPFRPGLIDRVLVAVEYGGATPVICVNKIELRTAADRLEALDDFRALSVRIIETSCATGQGIDELRGAIRGRTCVVTGHSGVGKSSLINALFPDLLLATGEVGKKGRHTTSSSCLHEDTDGTTIIDTPGIREFGLWKVGPGELNAYFSEFRELARGCRFNDCTHTHEPECAVRTAKPPRYERYLRLLGSL
jgi:ribosome biogenesis GTPase / thiamine phosphate phosphatase